MSKRLTIAGLLFLTVAIAIGVGSGRAMADTLDTALERLSQGDYSETVKAIDEIANSQVDHAARLLEALAARDLVFDNDGKAYVKADGGKILDARTWQEVERPDGRLKSARVNNRLRNMIRAAIGTMTLASPDPETRLAAAASVFRSQDTEALDAVRKALAAEDNPEIATALAQAEAAILLTKDDASTEEKLRAISVLEERGDQDAMAILRPAMTDENADVAEAVGAAVAGIEQRQAMMERVQDIWYGLSLGSVLLLAAIGLAITFGVMGVINMAHGEMVMLGAYTTFAVQEVFRAFAPDLFDYSLLLAVPMAFAVAGLVGIAIERGIIRFLYGRPLETLLATWGVSLILQQAVRTIFGATNREVGAPSYMQGGFEFLGLAITYNRLWIILFALVVFALLLLVLRRTPLGLQMRAVTQNRRMAASMGIRTGYVDAMTFGLGSGVAGIAGVALSQIDNVSPNLGQSYIVDSFLVVVFGGVGNLWGTLVSAFSLGIVNKLLEPWAGAVLAKIFILVLLILFIQKRPRGLFALKGRAVDA